MSKPTVVDFAAPAWRVQYSSKEEAGEACFTNYAEACAAFEKASKQPGFRGRLTDGAWNNARRRYDLAYCGEGVYEPSLRRAAFSI